MKLKMGDIIRIKSDYVTPDGVILKNHYFLIVETGYDFYPYFKGVEFDIEALAFTSLKNVKGGEKINRLLYDENNILVYKEDYIEGKLFDSVVKCDCLYVLEKKNIKFSHIDTLKKERLDQILSLINEMYDKDQLLLNVNNINNYS